MANNKAIEELLNHSIFAADINGDIYSIKDSQLRAIAATGMREGMAELVIRAQDMNPKYATLIEASSMLYKMVAIMIVALDAHSGELESRGLDAMANQFTSLLTGLHIAKRAAEEGSTKLMSQIQK